MSDSDIFQQQPPESTEPPVATPPTAQTDPFADKLSSIKNEQGLPKYKDVPTALEALAASQQFIETLKQEKAQTSLELETARSELSKLGNIDDFVKKISPPAQAQEPSATPQVSTGLSEERVLTLLQQQIEQRDLQSQQNINLAEVTKTLSGVYGEKSSAVIQQKAKELGTTVEALKELSKDNPRMALALLGETPKPPNAPSQTSVNMPHTPQESNPIPVFQKGATRGGFTSKELQSMFNQSKAYTNKRIGVEDATNK